MWEDRRRHRRHHYVAIGSNRPWSFRGIPCKPPIDLKPLECKHNARAAPLKRNQPKCCSGCGGCAPRPKLRTSHHPIKGPSSLCIGHASPRTFDRASQIHATVQRFKPLGFMDGEKEAVVCVSLCRERWKTGVFRPAPRTLRGFDS